MQKPCARAGFLVSSWHLNYMEPIVRNSSGNSRRDLECPSHWNCAPTYSAWCSKHRQYPGVAVEVMPCDLATGEKADQRHVAKGLPHHLQLGMSRTEVRAAASRATDIYRARHVPSCAALQFVADFRRDAHQIELCGFCVARAKSQTHAVLDWVGDCPELVL